MEKFNEIRNLIAEVEADMIKFYEKGNASAGTRIRKAMQDIKKVAQEIRIDVQNKKNQGT